MYYKIINKDCKVYKQLYEQRSKELIMEEENRKSIQEKTGLSFTEYLGYAGQQNFNRVTIYEGFSFHNFNAVDLKIWKEDKNNKGLFLPNRKTKAGREMAEFLANGLSGSAYDIIWSILKVDRLRKFAFPYVEIIADIIIVFLDHQQEPKDENVIEITKKEFNEILAH